VAAERFQRAPLAVGQQAGAVRGDRRPGDLSIDGALEGMVVMPPRPLDELSQAGSIARAMLLRATLARTSDDARLAARWSSAVKVL
jgi:hypothetical protein